MKKLLKRLAIVLVGLFLAVVCVEVLTRVFDPFGISHFINMKRYRSDLCEVRPGSDRLFAHLPNEHMELHGWEIRTDSNGLRGPERSSPKPQGTRRMMFVGDSVTFGWGVELEGTFVHMIGEELNKNSDTVWETINAGHLFHDSTQERGVVEEVGLSYEPDVVFLVFVANDTHPTAQMLLPATERPVKFTEEDVAEIERRAAVLTQLRKLDDDLPYTNRLLSFMYTNYRNASFKKKPGNEARDPYLLDRAGIDKDLGWELSRKAIIEMNEMVTATGSVFVVLDITKRPKVEEFCSEHSLLYARITHGEDEMDDIRNSLSDPHANRKGHRQYADKILCVIKDLELAGN